MIECKRKQVFGSNIVPVLGMMLLVLFASFSRPAVAQEQEDPYFEDLVFAVFVGTQRLSAGIFAVQQNGRYYLPVGAISEVLGFHVEMDRANRVVEGWSLSEETSFLLDSQREIARYRGEQTGLSREAFLDANIADDDVYVLMEVLEQVWPLQFEVNLGALVLRVLPDQILPFQKALARKERQKKALNSRALRVNQQEEPFPFIAQPYKLLGKPAIDLDVQAGFDDQTEESLFNVNISGVQDLGYASADYSLSLLEKGGDFDRPKNLRLRFRRQNIYDGALPLGLEDTQWGDVRLENRDLISRGLTGRGLIFTTRENHRSPKFDQITVDGISSSGWEAELYVNNELIDFAVVDERGEYRFEDVSVNYGNNRIRVVLYGLQGQVEERAENYFYQSNMVKAGENSFSGGIVHAEHDLIPIERQRTSRPDGVAASFYGARGLSDKMTAFASLNALPDDDGAKEVSRKYVSAGLVRSFDATLAQVELYKEIGGGAAVDFRTLSDFFGFKVNTRTALYNNLESPDAGNNLNAKKFESDVNVRRIFSTFLGSLGLEIGADYLKRKNGVSTTKYKARQSLGLKGARITNQTNMTLSNGDHVATNGRLSSTVRMNDWRLRNSFNYELYPDLRGTSSDIELRYGNIRDFSAAFRLQRNFSNQETVAGFQITRDFDKFLGSFDTDWSSRTGFGFMVRASSSFGPYDKDGGYIMNSDPMRLATPVLAKIYMDKDYDGTFSEGDIPLPETKISIGRRITKEETNAAGYLLDLNPGAGGRANVKVSTATIDDPYLVSSVDGYSIYPRPGVVHSLDFPLIETGAIDGTLRWETGGKPIAGLQLQLMNGEADIVQESKTAVDGYFTFERIPPASYTIRAHPESGMSIPFKYVDLTTANLFQFGMDIDVVDLTSPVESGLNVAVGQDGALNATSILSIAKGYKGRRNSQKKTMPKIVPKAEIKIEKTIEGVTQKKVLPHHFQPASGSSIVEAVRIGEHPDKIRIVMDLSAPISYALNYDPSSNSVFVEIPYVTWAAKGSWKSTSASILSNYQVEKIPSGGVRLILGVQDGVEIGGSGLLEAQAGKKDRLYIDIEKK